MGKLTIVATPIGNLGDLSPRARESLAECESWIVEDTRVSGKLQSVLRCKKPMHVLNEQTTEVAIAKMADKVKQGPDTCLLTDGGTPAISDPGAMFVDRCYQVGVEVDSVPGPSAVPNALALSGFFAQRFVFLGFLGRKPADISKILKQFADSSFTLVLFESPNRIEPLLVTAFETLGNRRYVICREMTKQFQQVFRGLLPEIPSETLMMRKGEVTIVIEGRRKP